MLLSHFRATVHVFSPKGVCGFQIVLLSHFRAFVQVFSPKGVFFLSKTGRFIIV